MAAKTEAHNAEDCKRPKAASLLIGACFEPKPEEAVIIRKKDVSEEGHFRFRLQTKPRKPGQADPCKEVLSPQAVTSMKVDPISVEHHGKHALLADTKAQRGMLSDQGDSLELIEKGAAVHSHKLNA